MNGEVSLRDKELLRHASNGLSGIEIEAVMGIPAATAILRIKDLLADKDVWTQVEQRKLILHAAYALKERIENIEGDADIMDPKFLDTRLKLIRTISDLLERQSGVSEHELAVVTQAQARALMGLVQAGYEHARELLANRYPDVDLAVIDGAFQVGMQEAVTDGAE